MILPTSRTFPTSVTAWLILGVAVVGGPLWPTRSASAADWPMWRYDAGHTAASPHGLPDQLQPAWTRAYAPRVPVWDDPLNRDIMDYDTIFEPVVSGGRMFVGFNDTDRVAALDCATGEQLWSVPTDGPVRLPPACFADKVYAASYYDLTNISGTASLGGFKSGCTSNLIAADGVLNAPDYTRSCSCAYQNQTSLALVHLPEVETWTVGQFAGKLGNARIRRIGINLGAPGDRRADEGTLWVEYPRVGGPSPEIPIAIEGPAEWFRRHSSRVAGSGLAWVGASGVRGAEKITLQLGDHTPAPTPLYTARLYFVEPDETVRGGQRVFDVTLQGKTVLPDFDVAAQAGAPNRLVVREFTRVAAGEQLTIEFTPRSEHPPVISGLEIIEQ